MFPTLYLNPLLPEQFFQEQLENGTDYPRINQLRLTQLNFSVENLPLIYDPDPTINTGWINYKIYT